MASGINIYSQLLISLIRVVDISNQLFELVISASGNKMLIPLAIETRVAVVPGVPWSYRCLHDVSAGVVATRENRT